MATLRKDQTACKPGSVPPAEADAAAIPLDRPLPDGSRDPPGPPRRQRRRCPSKDGHEGPYLVLLQAGLAMPSLSPGTRCALTAPFHPCLPTLEELREAVCFLWRYPWARARRALPAALSPWSPDFPRAPLREPATARPSDPARTWSCGHGRSTIDKNFAPQWNRGHIGTFGGCVGEPTKLRGTSVRVQGKRRGPLCGL